MAHLPGHKFVGPGTTDLEADPSDADDRVAKFHDQDYAAARTNEDIRLADLSAIEGFLKTGHQEPHGYIGAAGLGLKYAIETITGPLYGKGKCYQAIIST